MFYLNIEIPLLKIKSKINNNKLKEVTKLKEIINEKNY